MNVRGPTLSTTVIMMRMISIISLHTLLGNRSSVNETGKFQIIILSFKPYASCYTTPKINMPTSQKSVSFEAVSLYKEATCRIAWKY